MCNNTQIILDKNKSYKKFIKIFHLGNKKKLIKSKKKNITIKL